MMPMIRPRQTAVSATRPAHPGQTLILFTLFLTGLLGLLGLATDLGISFAGRRSMQNAADAAAFAGARAIAKAATGASVSVAAEVEAMATANAYSFSAPVVESCVYVNDGGQALGACGTAIPPSATGVRVTVAETHPTFFIRVVPGAPATATTRATASANVQKLATMPSDGPFLVCGIETRLASGGRLSILNKVNGEWQINPAAVEKTFRIYMSNAGNSPTAIARCGQHSSEYKGLADQDSNRPLTAPDWFYFEGGKKVGYLSADVEGAQGCRAGEEVNNCVAFLPIAVNDPPPVDSSSLYTVGFAPFYITKQQNNDYHGRLIGVYIVRGPAESGWTPDYYGPIVIRLTS